MIIRQVLRTQALDKKFRRLVNNSTRLKPALIQIGGVLEDASETAFDRQGPGWKRLSPKYKKQKAKKFGAGKKILEGESGLLKGSVNSGIRGKVIAIGSGLEYARTHQQGDKSRKIPARPFLIISEAEIFKAKNILHRHLVKGI